MGREWTLFRFHLSEIKSRTHRVRLFVRSVILAYAATREDRCTLRRGHGAEAMAVINNLVLGLLLRRGVKNVPDARRDFDADPKQAFDLIVGRA